MSVSKFSEMSFNPGYEDESTLEAAGPSKFLNQRLKQQILAKYLSFVELVLGKVSKKLFDK